jgi:hypothetical protein
MKYTREKLDQAEELVAHAERHLQKQTDLVARLGPDDPRYHREKLLIRAYQFALDENRRRRDLIRDGLKVSESALAHPMRQLDRVT